MTTHELSVPPSQLQDLRTGAVVVREASAVFAVAGPGALECLQGLLTNDLAAPGANRLVYGALLTPKGMIVADYWVCRLPGRIVLVARPEAHDASLELFRQRLPPRLAATTDLSGEWATLRLYGADAAPALARILPDAVAEEPAVVRTSGELVVARGTATAPFAVLVTGPAAEVDALAAQLAGAGVRTGDATDAEAARILAGWPRLGAEIGERTLPQEVRFDEIGGVSYTKGCYIGQETVARLHFRGHTNRDLRGVAWRDDAPLAGDALELDGKAVGTVHSTLASDGRRVGLALVRREVATGTELLAGGLPARVVELPFPTDAIA